MKIKGWLFAAAVAAVIVVAAMSGGCGKPVEAQSVGQRFYFTWPGDDGDVGTAAGVEIRVSTAVFGADTVSWWNAAPIRQLSPPPTPKVAGTRDSIDVLGLASQTTYRAIMKAHDEVPNYSGFSNGIIFTSGDVVRPNPPRNLSVQF